MDNSAVMETDSANGSPGLSPSNFSTLNRDSLTYYVGDNLSKFSNIVYLEVSIVL